ncbi:MAG: TM0106 family RecB-like putative nuclease [Rhodospirillales bacterium]|nr:MAG: TM0106 family RecB-like putative nuclease [Rhodospirillales bacterium]
MPGAATPRPGMPTISASTLYALVQCPHRVARDAFDPPSDRDAVGAFTRMLWDNGTRFERETIAALATPYVELGGLAPADKGSATLAAMGRGEALIHGGRVAHGDLVAEPDLLRREGAGYVPGDIKSGAAADGGDSRDGRLNRRYAVQLALCVDILERLGLSAGRRGFVWDAGGHEVAYDLEARGDRARGTLWEVYERALEQARGILAGAVVTLPAASTACRLCHWNSTCRAAIVAADDLTLIPELGRARRDAMIGRVRSVAELARADVEAFIHGARTDFPRVSPDTLRRFHARARLLKSPDPRPYLRAPHGLPSAAREIFLDIEADPLRDRVYLHGLIEADRPRAALRFTSFVAERPDAASERRAFADALAHLAARPDAVVFVYSAYERRMYRKLAARYPELDAAAAVEALFAPGRAVDLHETVRAATEWPTSDLSIKTLAGHLGFKWRDPNPSGAASIEWYDRYVADGDAASLRRIVDYNEDDCRAMVVLLDAIRSLPPP